MNAFAPSLVSLLHIAPAGVGVVIIIGGPRP